VGEANGDRAAQNLAEAASTVWLESCLLSSMTMSAKALGVALSWASEQDSCQKGKKRAVVGDALGIVSEPSPKQKRSVDADMVGTLMSAKDLGVTASCSPAPISTSKSTKCAELIGRLQLERNLLCESSNSEQGMSVSAASAEEVLMHDCSYKQKLSARSEAHGITMSSSDFGVAVGKLGASSACPPKRKLSEEKGVKKAAAPLRLAPCAAFTS